MRARDLWSDCTTFCGEIISLWESEIYRTSITRNAFPFIAVRSSDTDLWPVQTSRVHKLSNQKTSWLSNGLCNTWGQKKCIFLPVPREADREKRIIQPLSESYGYDRLWGPNDDSPSGALPDQDQRCRQPALGSCSSSARVSSNWFCNCCGWWAVYSGSDGFYTRKVISQYHITSHAINCPLIMFSEACRYFYLALKLLYPDNLWRLSVSQPRQLYRLRFEVQIMLRRFLFFYKCRVVVNCNCKWMWKWLLRVTIKDHPLV